MTNLLIQSESTPLTVDVSALMMLPQMSDAQFYEFCQCNPDLHIERTAEGEIIVMPPAFSDTGNRNNQLNYQVTRWAEADGTGEVFDSSAGFTLPNGAMRSPDTSWIRLERWNALTDAQKASFAPICPDFVIELRSASDSLQKLRAKMQEYVENGVRLGLLIDRKNRQVSCYRRDGSVVVLDDPVEVRCEPELPGFVLQLARIW